MGTLQPDDDIDVIVRRSAARQWGLGLFFSCSIWCVITLGLLYFLTVVSDNTIGDVGLWLAVIFCGLPYLIASIGLVMAVSAVPCAHLPEVWPKLKKWQQLLIASFIFIAIYFLIVCAYFLISLTVTYSINAEGT